MGGFADRSTTRAASTCRLTHACLLPYHPAHAVAYFHQSAEDAVPQRGLCAGGDVSVGMPRPDLTPEEFISSFLHPEDADEGTVRHWSSSSASPAPRQGPDSHGSQSAAKASGAPAAVRQAAGPQRPPSAQGGAQQSELAAAAHWTTSSAALLPGLLMQSAPVQPVTVDSRQLSAVSSPRLTWLPASVLCWHATSRTWTSGCQCVADLKLEAPTQEASDDIGEASQRAGASKAAARSQPAAAAAQQLAGQASPGLSQAPSASGTSSEATPAGSAQAAAAPAASRVRGFFSSAAATMAELSDCTPAKVRTILKDHGERVAARQPTYACTHCGGAACKSSDQVQSRCDS